MDLVGVILLYTVTGKASFAVLIKILQVSNTSVLVNMTQINGKVETYSIVSLPLSFIWNPNASGNVTYYDGVQAIETTLKGNVKEYVDSYNGIVLGLIINGENYTLTGASIELAPGVYKPLPSNHNYDFIETFVLTAVLVVSFSFLLERVSK
ncbi:MAG: hypothetical protein OWQ54_05265 [Sulfolobaceae archaeon]|nr:hypothetical protein [Sulfolobaceae archaeon]